MACQCRVNGNLNRPWGPGARARARARAFPGLRLIFMLNGCLAQPVSFRNSIQTQLMPCISSFFFPASFHPTPSGSQPEVSSQRDYRDSRVTGIREMVTKCICTWDGFCLFFLIRTSERLQSWMVYLICCCHYARTTCIAWVFSSPFLVFVLWMF